MSLANHRPLVYIAMSSGVDSSVAAALLIHSGHENLQPFYMANWSPSANPPSVVPPQAPYNKPQAKNSTVQTQPFQNQDSGKCTEREFNDVKDICQAMGLKTPLYMSFEKEYWNEVFTPMIETFQRGRTPNPDIECNRQIKFGVVVKRLEREFRREQNSRKFVDKKVRKWWMATGRKISDPCLSYFSLVDLNIHTHISQATMPASYITSRQTTTIFFVLVIQIKTKHSSSLQSPRLSFLTSFSHSAFMGSQSLMSKLMLEHCPFQDGGSENPSAKKAWGCVLLNPVMEEEKVDSADGYESILTQSLEISSLGHLGPMGPTNRLTDPIPHHKGR